MKKLLAVLAVLFVSTLVACNDAEEASNKVEARATYELARVYVDEVEVAMEDTEFSGSKLTFVGPEAGGNVLIQVGDTLITASINPSREHPSFEEGVWHHHLYAGSTESGSVRINFRELLPALNIDENPEANDNTQSISQHGNLHFMVEEEEFRLRFTINGEVHELFFTEV
jgi:hypothetical protein